MSKPIIGWPPYGVAALIEGFNGIDYTFGG